MDMKNIEKQIGPLIEDFDTFINYIEKNSPRLSAKMLVLGKKDSFALNEQMNFKNNVIKASYNQDKYLIIDLIFSLCIDGGLFFRASEEKGKIKLVKTNKLDGYKKLNNLEKYVFIVETFWSKYHNDKISHGNFSVINRYNLMTKIAELKEGYMITKGSKSDIGMCFSTLSRFTHHLKFLGWCDLELIEGAKSKYDDSIKEIKPTKLGIEICKKLTKEAITYWGEEEAEFLVYSYDEDYNKENKSLFHIISQVFSKGTVSQELEEEEINKKGAYIFKVSLDKNLWRTIRLCHNHTFHEFHMLIQRAYDFDNDHLYGFYIGNKSSREKEIYSGNPMGVSDEYEELTIEEANLYEGQILTYLFDYGDEWKFNIRVEEFIENEKGLTTGEILESKGKSPEQYSMW
jgi:hypothetical protein